MKHAYVWAQLLLAVLLLFSGLRAGAQQAWRPFRPGLIYSYAAAPATASTEYYTLRVDSAYAAANGDSVYAFNRRLRQATTPGLGNAQVKSRNNLFGAVLRWRPGQPGYTLEALAQTNVQEAVSLILFPRAAVGGTWVASSQPLQTATLVSRGWQTIGPGVQDTVAVVAIVGSGPPATLRLSRRYGLLAGPQWLGGATGSALEQVALPTRFEQSVYSPLRVFDVQVGDEFGYEEYDLGISPVRCSETKLLRRILSKQLTADSLIITYQEQTRYESFGYVPYCYSPASVSYSAIVVKRWQLALTGNQWQPTAPIAQFAALRLLTGEYIAGYGPGFGSSSFLLAGLPIARVTQCSGSTANISYAPYYYYLPTGSTTPLYRSGVDLAAWQYRFGEGVTTTVEGMSFMVQSYTRKTVNSVTIVCGNPQAFVNLLPTRATEAAAVAMLAPNPAAEAATLTLAQPARSGTILRLTDALGRVVWTAPVAAGATVLPVPLSGQPAGLYLLRLSGPDAAGAAWKLLH